MDATKYNQYSITKRLIQTKLEGFTVTDKAILICLVSYMKKDDKSKISTYVGQRTIAKLMGTTPKKVIEALHKFEDAGFISSVKRYDNSKIYTWIGLTPEEREFNLTKVKRSNEDWDNWRANAPKIDKLKLELDYLIENQFKDLSKLEEDNKQDE